MFTDLFTRYTIQFNPEKNYCDKYVIEAKIGFFQ